jgi:hypothetical protein
MTAWAPNELGRIAEADDLHIAPVREDGGTYDGDLYVRAYNGPSSRWYQAALRQKAGRIIAAGMTTEVTFEPVAGAINDRIDEAYRAKYRGNPYLASMISARARSATVMITPGDGGATRAGSA